VCACLSEYASMCICVGVRGYLFCHPRANHSHLIIEKPFLLQKRKNNILHIASAFNVMH
jgi:hypothetical protein